ncbi:Protein IDA-LIKE 2 [Cardamine amara subsp. amara]|uniref:Protein IDA-LIKE 2 n=1 Tax=Cardamine amara subsp. amara TaxID=228776 RepID=A0ABD1B918_CARAN
MSSRNRRSRITSMFFIFFTRTIILLLLLLGHCNGARTSTNVFNSKPLKEENDVVSSSSQQFLGFLPRHFPVPASGPSRKHNDIGLLSWHRSSP